MPRLIDADALLKKKLRTQMFGLDWEMVFAKDIEDAPTIDPESLRAHGRWNYNHRHRGGFRRYTGLDSMGEQHAITVDERFEVDDPYCSECGKLNESVFLNFCPNCGAKMEKECKNEA